jgi:hypothetical protein
MDLKQVNACLYFIPQLFLVMDTIKQKLHYFHDLEAIDDGNIGRIICTKKRPSELNVTFKYTINKDEFMELFELIKTSNSSQKKYYLNLEKDYQGILANINSPEYLQNLQKNDEIKHLNEKIRTTNDELKKEKGKISNIQAAHAKEKESLQKNNTIEINHKKEQISILEGKNKNQEVAIKNFKTEKTTFTTKFNEQEKEINTLKKENTEVKKLKDKIQYLENELQQIKFNDIYLIECQKNLGITTDLNLELKKTIVQLTEENETAINDNKSIQKQLQEQISNSNYLLQQVESINLKSQLLSSDLEQLKLQNYQKEMVSINEKAGNRGDNKILDLSVDLTHHNNDDLSYLYTECRSTDLTILVDAVKISNNQIEYNEIISKLSTICFIKLWDITFPNGNIEINAKKILEDKNFKEENSTLLINEVTTAINQHGIEINDYQIEQKELIKSFCIKCLFLSAKMKTCKPTLYFFSPTVNSTIEDSNYDYFDFKPIIKLVLSPGIKASDGWILIKANVILKH